MSSNARHTANAYFRADYILVATTVCVCALATLLLVALAGANGLHRQTLQTIHEARGVRDAALSLTQALAGADAARRAALVSGDRDAQLTYGEAKRRARVDVARIDTVGGATPEVAVAASLVHRLTEQYLAQLDAVSVNDLRSGRIDPTAASRLELSTAIDGLRELVNSRNDAARGREDRVRGYIDAIAAVLAIVAFLAPVLAILAVRRERRLWRDTNNLAEAARRTSPWRNRRRYFRQRCANCSPCRWFDH
jgi:CHASE3 domain sensor protein